MIRSLSIKLVMLAGTLGVIYALHLSGTGNRTESQVNSGQLLPAHASTEKISNNLDRGSTYTPLIPLERYNQSSPKKPYTNSELDLNLSTAQELESLPGIGPVLAQRIVDYRRQIGSFHSLKELDAVKGIGRSKLNAIRPMLKISPQTNLPKEPS